MDDLAPLEAVIAERAGGRTRPCATPPRRRTPSAAPSASTTTPAPTPSRRFARDLLGVADKLERALLAAPKDAEGPATGLVAGVEMTQKALQQAFERNGLKKVDPDGRDLRPPPAPGDDGAAVRHACRAAR